LVADVAGSVLLSFHRDNRSDRSWEPWFARKGCTTGRAVPAPVKALHSAGRLLLPGVAVAQRHADADEVRCKLAITFGRTCNHS